MALPVPWVPSTQPLIRVNREAAYHGLKPLETMSPNKPFSTEQIINHAYHVSTGNTNNTLQDYQNPRHIPWEKFSTVFQFSNCLQSTKCGIQRIHRLKATLTQLFNFFHPGGKRADIWNYHAFREPEVQVGGWALLGICLLLIWKDYTHRQTLVKQQWDQPWDSAVLSLKASSAMSVCPWTCYWILPQIMFTSSGIKEYA